MKILLAGPGTGKTTKIKSLLEETGDISRCLIISFTNATVNDLQKSLSLIGVNERNCMTLHKFAVKYNHDKTRHILLKEEEGILNHISQVLEIGFTNLCDLLNSTTFEQMIYRFIDFIRSNPLYIKESLSGFDTLIVDEYQDFNNCEQNLIDLLISNIDNSYILGDDDQCIYDFKDADNEKIISFYEDSKNDKISHENKCYRCPDIVVNHSLNLIRNNKKRVNKDWLTTGNEGEIHFKQLPNFNIVASFIVNKIEEIRKQNQQDKIMILSPVRFATDSIINLLDAKGMEYTNHFQRQFSPELVRKSWEIRSIFGNHKYINLLLLGYSILSNRKKFYELIKKHFETGLDYNELFALLRRKLPNELSKKYKNIEEILSEETYSKINLLYQVSNGGTPEEKIENIFKNEENSNNGDIKIEIMSIHKSKGLGADIVFIVGLVEGILPNKKKGLDSIECQRRLLYVGMTRAKSKLYLLSNMTTLGKDMHTVNKDEFKYVPRLKSYVGKTSSFISELKL